jgi:hypothetical protein
MMNFQILIGKIVKETIIGLTMLIKTGLTIFTQQLKCIFQIE